MVLVRFAAGFGDIVRFATGLAMLVRFAAGLTVLMRLTAGLTVLVRLTAEVLRVVVRVRGVAAAARRVVAFFAAVRAVVLDVRLFVVDVRAVAVDVRVLVAAAVRLAVGADVREMPRAVVVAAFAAGLALLPVLFAARLATGRVVVFAVRLVVLRVAGAVRFDILGAAAVVSSMLAPGALRRTDLTPLRAAAFEPYACEVATSWPLGARRVNRNLPALSLLRVNFAGTNASRCGAVALCGRRWAPIEH
jgi:hypothetical protein